MCENFCIYNVMLYTNNFLWIVYVETSAVFIEAQKLLTFSP